MDLFALQKQQKINMEIEMKIIKDEDKKKIVVKMLVLKFILYHVRRNVSPRQYVYQQHRMKW